MTEKQKNFIYIFGGVIIITLLTVLVTMLLYNANNKKRDREFIEVIYSDDNFLFINENLLKYQLDLKDYTLNIDYRIVEDFEVYYKVNNNSSVLNLASDFEVEIIEVISTNRFYVRVNDLKKVDDFRFFNNDIIKIDLSNN